MVIVGVGSIPHCCQSFGSRTLPLSGPAVPWPPGQFCAGQGNVSLVGTMVCISSRGPGVGELQGGLFVHMVGPPSGEQTLEMLAALLMSPSRGRMG